MHYHCRAFAKRVIVLIAWAVALPASALCADDAPLAHSIFVMRTDGSEVRQLVTVEGFKYYGSPRWSHDGRRLVFAASESPAGASKLFLVDADGKNLTELGPGGEPDWSPDDKQFAFTAGLNRAVTDGIWVQNVDGRGDEHLCGGLAPHWSPDGSRIALVADAGLYLLDQIDFERRLLCGANERIAAVRSGFDWSPDGRQLAAVVERAGRWEVVIVDVEASPPQLRTRLAAQADSVAWSPDGRTLAVSLWNDEHEAYRLHLLDIAGDAPPREISGQAGDNRAAAWSPDGAHLAFLSTRPIDAAPRMPVTSGAVRLERTATFDCGGTCYSLAIAPDGRTALLGANMGSRRLQVLDLATLGVERTIPMLGIFVAISPDGEHAACTQRFKKAVTYFKLADGKTVRELPSAAPIWFVEFSAGGSHLVCGAQDGTACVFDVRTGTKLAEFDHKGRVATGALSPDGRHVAVAASDNKVHVWDVASKQQIYELDHPDLVWSVAFSPDGRLIATGTGAAPIGQIAAQRVPSGSDNKVRLWEAATGKRLRELAGHEHAVASVAFSPDGRRLATGSFDKSLRLWDVERGVELARAADGQSWIFKVAYAPDGQSILTSGGNARVNMTDRRLTDFPTERVRIFQIVPAADAAPSEGT